MMVTVFFLYSIITQQIFQHIKEQPLFRTLVRLKEQIALSRQHHNYTIFLISSQVGTSCFLLFVLLVSR